MQWFHCLLTVLLVVVGTCTVQPQPVKKDIGQTATRAPIVAASAPSTYGKVVALSAMQSARAAHIATLLPNGQVLLTGGFNRQAKALASAELFDPTSGHFLPAGAMNIARQSHTATLLPNGKVLLAGGYDETGAYLDQAELYDPLTGDFTPTAPLTTARAGHSAVLLANGTVLLVGGVGTGWTFLASAEIYDPLQNTFRLTGSMTTARESHTATLLDDGTVLIVGGHQGRRSALTLLASAEIYHPVSGSFTATHDLLTRRHKHDAVLLADGTVLVIGGADERDDGGQYTSAERYHPDAGRFTSAGAMHLPRYKFQGTAILLRNGHVLISAGANRMEIYDPLTSHFSLVQNVLGTTRLFAATAYLPDDTVLLTGGYGPTVAASANAWLFQP